MYATRTRIHRKYTNGLARASARGRRWKDIKTQVKKKEINNLRKWEREREGGLRLDLARPSISLIPPPQVCQVPQTLFQLLSIRPSNYYFHAIHKGMLNNNKQLAWDYLIDVYT